MAYSSDNPPICVKSTASGGVQVWAYNSTDAHALVAGPDYFANGYALGMRAGDHVHVGNTSAPSLTLHLVTAVTVDGAATVSAATLA